jgi:hypothetical protein
LRRLTTDLAALIALIPASLGQKAKTASLAVTLASDEDLLAATGAVGDAVVAAGATGSISAKLRRLTTDVAALFTGIILAAGENHNGQVGSHSTAVVVTLAGSTTPAYSSSDILGGKITVANAVRVSGGSGWLTSLQISDLSNVKPTGTIFVFGSNPAATYTDNAGSPISNADAQAIIAQIPVSTGDYITSNNRAFANPLFNPKQVKAASGTTLYAVFVLTNTFSLAGANDVQLTFGFSQD